MTGQPARARPNATRMPTLPGPVFGNVTRTGSQLAAVAGAGLPRGLDRFAHDGVVLPFGAHVAEAGLLEEAAGDAIEERCRDLLAAGVLG